MSGCVSQKPPTTLSIPSVAAGDISNPKLALAAGYEMEGFSVTLASPAYSLPLALGKIINLEEIKSQFQLRENQKELLQKNGFVVIPWHGADIVEPYKTMKEPLVSIVIPCYNKQQTLPQSLQSVFEQSYSNIEIVAVDDNSTDHSAQALSLIKDKRLVRHFLPSNGGVVNAYREGIRRAKGEFIMFHDSDDISMPDRVEKCMRVIGDNDVVYHGIYLISQHPEYPITGRRYAPPEKWEPKRIFKEQYIPGVIFARKDILMKVKFPKEAEGAWDWMHHILLHQLGAKYVALDEGLYDYWRFTNNSLSNHNSMSGGRQDAIVWIQKYLKKNKLIKDGHKFGKGFRGICPHKEENI